MLDINAVMVSLNCRDGETRLSMQIGCEERIETSALSSLTLTGGRVICDVDENDITVDILLSKGGAAND